MTTETILTKELIDELAEKYLWGDAQFIGAGDVTVEGEEEFARAIQKAVLQSDQVQAWKKDAEAFRLMVSKRLTVSVRELGHEIEVFHLDDCLAWPACDPNADDDTRAEVARSAIATAVAAMEEQK